MSLPSKPGAGAGRALEEVRARQIARNSGDPAPQAKSPDAVRVEPVKKRPSAKKKPAGGKRSEVPPKGPTPV